MSGHALPPATVHSLAVQARFLTGRLEYHLLGNHLWTNGKALAFAGAFFEGQEAARWLETGLGIVAESLPSRYCLTAGTSSAARCTTRFSSRTCSTSRALAPCFPGVVPDADGRPLAAALAAMLGWLETMTHPDGDIAFFNDAALGIAARPAVLHSLAGDVGIQPRGRPALQASPVSTRAATAPERGRLRGTGRRGPDGPDYIPGHAHADTLSFELSWRGRRVLGNSGTSCYGTSAQRERERGTAAHNTVTVDDADSSEVWSGFRVARRARPVGLEATVLDGCVVAACAHDGYRRLPGRPIHRRAWQLGPQKLRIRDEISGSGEHRATGYLHVQPGIVVTFAGEGAFDLDVPEAGRLRLTVETPATVGLEDGFVAPEFGRLVPRPVIAWRLAGSLPLSATVALTPVA